MCIFRHVRFQQEIITLFKLHNFFRIPILLERRVIRFRPKDCKNIVVFHSYAENSKTSKSNDVTNKKCHSKTWSKVKYNNVNTISRNE